MKFCHTYSQKKTEEYANKYIQNTNIQTVSQFIDYSY